MRNIFALAVGLALIVQVPSAWSIPPATQIVLRCGPPAGDLVNGTYVIVGKRFGKSKSRYFAQITEYRKGETTKRGFDVKQMRCPCPKAFEGSNLRLQVSDFSMSWLTQGPRRKNHLATLEYKRHPASKTKTLGVACQIM